MSSAADVDMSDAMNGSNKSTPVTSSLTGPEVKLTSLVYNIPHVSCVIMVSEALQPLQISFRPAVRGSV